MNVNLMRISFVCTLCLCLLLVVDARAEDQPQDSQQPVEVVYKQVVDLDDEPYDLKLHVFHPDDWSPDDQRPVVIFFFGGGWNGGSPSQFYPNCRDLAALGMVAISADYRVRSRHGTSPIACVEDGRSAVRYVRDHANELGIDPDRLVAAGGSAGGHVAAATALVVDVDDPADDPEVSAVPNALALFNPVIDTSRETGYGGNRLGEDHLRLSPVHRVRADQPPVIVFHGDADRTVPISAARRFDEACKAVGASCELVAYEDRGHGFFNHPLFRANNDIEVYRDILARLVAFLKNTEMLTRAGWSPDLPPDIEPEVLLITHDTLAESWQDFAIFKTRLGRPTTILTVQEIDAEYEGDDIQQKIRAAAQDYIEHHGTRYIVLGGDSSPGTWPDGGGLVPDRDTLHREMRYRDIPTDLYYLSPGEYDWDANNNGVYGEWPADMEAVRYTHPSGAAIGRIPVRTAEDVAAYTDKVIDYETNYPEGDFAQGIIYSNTVDGSEPKVRRSWDDYLSSVWEQGEVFRFYHTETAWDGDDTGDYSLNTEHWLDVINNQTAGKMHMHGHGMLGFWVLEDDGGHTLANQAIVDQLTNENAYLVMTTVSCFTGQYDGGDDPSITESMLRAPDRGAVAIIAPSREGVPIFHNPREDFRLMVTEGKLDGTTESMTRYWMNGLSPQEDGGYMTMGQAFMAMKGQMAEHAVQTAGYHWCQCELNFLGDPTLDMRARAVFSPSFTPGAPLPIALTDGGTGFASSAKPIRVPEGVTVCYWLGDQFYGTTAVDEEGGFTVVVPEGVTGELTLTVSGSGLNAWSETRQIRERE